MPSADAWKDRYVKNAELNLFQREDYSGIVYSDDAETELRLLDVVKNASDRGTFSAEIARQIMDWPSEYHLSRQRHCLLRPLGIQPADAVLELGSGCGAITRYAGELGAEVVAVEGAVRRARITAERCRDLPNVSIIAEDLLQFETDKKFDWVLLIGVLEYSPVFCEGYRPVQNYLRKAADFLKPGGRLVVAIENKFGIKYFNGCAEDHVGVPFYGVQGLYTRGQPRTFGKRELEDILNAAGLNQVAFWFPFPDYKLPRVILSDAGLADRHFHSAELLATVYARDYGGVDHRFFDEPLVFREAARNGLLGDLSNSFLAVASRADIANDVPTPLAVNYAVQRLPGFATETRFVRHQETIQVIKESLFPNLPNDLLFGDTTLRHLPAGSDYVCGRLTLWRLIEARGRRASTEKIVEALIPWFAYLLTHAHASAAGGDSRRLGDLTLAGHLVDLTPFNLIESEDGFHAIDLEWQVESHIPLGWVVTRSIVNSLSYPGFEASEIRIIDVINDLCSRYKYTVCDADIAEWLKLEGQFQTAVAGVDIDTAPITFGSRRIASLTEANDGLRPILRKLARSVARRLPRRAPSLPPKREHWP